MAVCCALLGLVSLAQTGLGESTSTYAPSNRQISFKFTQPGSWSKIGFYPVKITVTNNESQDTAWELTLESNYIGTIRAPKMQTITTTVFIPFTGSTRRYYYSANLVCRERATGAAYDLHINSDYSSYPVIASSQGLGPDLRKEIESRVHSSSSAVTMTPAEWPADARVYSSFSAFVMSSSDYEALDTSLKNAINQWVISGGKLLIVDLSEDGGEEKEASQKIGWGTMTQASFSDKKKAAEFLRRNLPSSIGEMGFPQLPYTAKSYELRSPAFILITLLIIFAVVVGPLCLFVWAPANKRQRLFILIPSISFGFSVLLMLLILLIDGTGGEGLRVASVYLNPQTNSATIKQQQICKTGLLLSSAFTLNEKAEFYAEDSNKEDNNDKKMRSGNTLSGSWFTSRSTITQKLSVSVPTRARVSLVSGDQNNPVVQSTVPCVLKDFVYKDDRGTFWKADSLPPGQKVPLTKLENIGKLVFMGENGNFNAQGEASELAPIDTLESIKWNNGDMFFFGPVTHE